ncbi:MAG: BadF/BadG/BcrA/BcrD ATPase family protein [Gemmatimonadales bacterium]
MIVLGADVGGTSSRVVLYDGDSERGRAEGPGGPMRAGEGDRLASRLADLARPLLSRAGSVRADAFVVGASGAGRSDEQTELQGALEKQRLAWRVRVTSDAELARAAAFEGGAGVLLIAGTGSIALARGLDGIERRVGGRGWRMGDQGSAHWIGARALEAVGTMHDGLGPTTHLAEALCVAAKVNGIAGLIRWSVRATPAEVASLAPAVLRAADSGDSVAVELRESAVNWLVRIAVAAGAGPLPVALSGGLLAPERGLRERVAEALEIRHSANVSRKPVDPCRGAVVLAVRG